MLTVRVKELFLKVVCVHNIIGISFFLSWSVSNRKFAKGLFESGSQIRKFVSAGLQILRSSPRSKACFQIQISDKRIMGWILNLSLLLLSQFFKSWIQLFRRICNPAALNSGICNHGSIPRWPFKSSFALKKRITDPKVYERRIANPAQLFAIVSLLSDLNQRQTNNGILAVIPNWKNCTLVW